MALYRDTCSILLREIPTKEFYRFEGAKTCSRFDPKNDQAGAQNNKITTVSFIIDAFI